MLVVTRYKDEGVRIGDNVRIKIIQVGESRVALGIEAPREIPVFRDEIANIAEVPTQGTRDAPLNVMVVEDTPIHAALIQKALAKHGGAKSSTVASAEEASRLLGLDGDAGSTPPDVILLDYRLPGKSGLDLLRSIRTNPPLATIPVVMLSCLDSATDVARCLEAGANAFVAKSETYEGFRQSIYRMVDFWSHARRPMS